jgi:hypothetical protein
MKNIIYIVFLLSSVFGFISTAGANPIKISPVAVTASNTYPGSPPIKVTDGDPNSSWIAGNHATQWIMLDLGKTVSAWKIRLLITQSPAGLTKHNIYAGQNPQSLSLVTTFNGVTQNGQWLEYSGGNLGGARYIRVETVTTPSWVAWAEIEVYQGPEYLGYFASAFDGHGTGDYTAETAAVGANLTWVRTSTNLLASKLSNAKNVSSKAIVVLDGQFFSITDTAISLNPNWEAEWQKVVNIIKSSGYEETVVAFYPLDEPYWVANLRNVNDATMRTWLETINNRIKRDFPSKPIGVILAVPELNKSADLFTTFNWLGFDYYGGPPNTNDAPPSWDQTQQYITALKAKLTGMQRLIAVPKTFLWDAVGSLSYENILIEHINNWHNEVLSDGRYILFAPFLWPTMNLNNNPAVETGARDLPWVRERLYQLAQGFFVPSDLRIFPASYNTSSNYGWQGPFSATNRYSNDAWGSGGNPPAYIEYDLGGSTKIKKIDLLTSQTPSGNTRHVIYVSDAKRSCRDAGTASSGWVQLTQFNAYTTDNQTLSWVGETDARMVCIATTQSPSWVGWREIGIYR